MEALKRLKENTLSFKQNFLWLTGGFTGMLAAQRWIIPDADLSAGVLIGLLIGGNIGNYIKNASGTGRKYDELDRRIMEESMAWGFMTAVTLLGVNLLTRTEFTYSEILLASGTATLTVTIIRELRQARKERFSLTRL